MPCLVTQGAACALAACLLALPLAAQNRAALQRAVDDYILHGSQIRPDVVPGFVVGVWDGDSTYVLSYGRLSNGQSPDADTPFSLGSTSKVFTLALIAELVRAGQMDWQRPLNDYLPAAYRHPQADHATLDAVARHRAGLPKLLSGALVAQHGPDAYAHISKAQVLDFYKNYNFVAADTGRYQYSHLGYALLEIAAEAQTGQAFGSLLRQYVFEPCGMARTGLQAPPGYTGGYNLAMQTVGTAPAYQSFAGALGLYGTAGDLLRFAQMFRRPDIAERWGAGQWADNPVPQHRRTYAGRAWHLRKGRRQHPILTHPGPQKAAHADLLIVPATQTAVVVLANSGYHMENLGEKVLEIVNGKRLRNGN